MRGVMNISLWFFSVFLFRMEYSLEFRSAISQLVNLLMHTYYLYLGSFMLLWNLTPNPFMCRVSLQTSFCFFLSFTFLSLVLSDTKELWSALGKWTHVTCLMQCTSLNFNGFFKKDQFAARILFILQWWQGKRSQGFSTVKNKKYGNFFKG